jgi:hypothetical protein
MVDMAWGKVVGRFLSTAEDTGVVGTPLTGSVRFKASYLYSLQQDDPTSILLPHHIDVPLDAQGNLFTDEGQWVSLQATDTEGSNPENFTWNLTFPDLRYPDGRLITSYTPYSISVPGGQITDLAEVTPVPAGNGTYIVRGPAGPEGPQGPPGSGGGSGGAVDSVNDRIGAVVLTSADVGLGNVANLAPIDLPISAVVQTALTTINQTVAGKVTTAAMQTFVAEQIEGFYTKPTGGITTSDLSTSVVSDLSLASSAVQPAAISGFYTKPVGGITSSDLANAVLSELALAASAVQPAALAGFYTKPVGGITSSDLANSVIAALTLADSAYQVPTGGIPISALTSSLQELINDGSGGGSGGAPIDDSEASTSSVYSSSKVAALISGFYSKPVGGITTTDLAPSVVTSLGLANTALQSAPVSSVATRTGAVTLTSADLTDATTLGKSIVTAASAAAVATAAGLGSVNNTADTAKPVSTAQQTALNLKANLASPAFTGTVTGITAAMVGLGSVTNVTPANLPISTAQAAVNAVKADLVGGIIPTSQMPPLALNTSVPVASQAAMLALTTTQVQPGDLAIRSDGTGTWMLMATDPSQLANWQNLTSVTDVVSSVNSKVGAVVLGAADVGLGNVANLAPANLPISTATQTALEALYTKPAGGITTSDFASSVVTSLGLANTALQSAPVSSVASRTGAITLTSADLTDSTTVGKSLITATTAAAVATAAGLGSVNNTADSAKPVSTAQQTALNLKANLASPTFTGTVGGITAAMVGLGNVTNTSDANKPVSTATASAIAAITATSLGLGSVNNTADADKPVSTAQASAISAAQAAGVAAAAAVTPASLGLGNVNNTSDAAKPLSTAAQNALSLLAPLASPTFTGTVGGLTAGMVGLGNVNNTSDSNKPISTATQTALNALYTKPTGGITTADLAASVVASLGLANTALQSAPVASVANRTGAVTLTSADLTDATTLGKSLVTTASTAAAQTSLGLSRVQNVGVYTIATGSAVPAGAVAGDIIVEY